MTQFQIARKLSIHMIFLSNFKIRIFISNEFEIIAVNNHNAKFAQPWNYVSFV